jgi:hypothetical protein
VHEELVMKETPETIEQWAEEAYIALEVAWRLLEEEYPLLKENEKIELIGYAPELAGMHRGVTDKDILNNTLESVCKSLAEDIKRKDDDEPIYYSISFLLAYMESNIIFGCLSERNLELIMEYLCENYEISEHE